MNIEDILATFKTLGKPQTAAIYKRHGSGDNVYGVLTSEIAKIKNRQHHNEGRRREGDSFLVLRCLALSRR